MLPVPKSDGTYILPLYKRFSKDNDRPKDEPDIRIEDSREVVNMWVDRRPEGVD